MKRLLYISLALALLASCKMGKNFEKIEVDIDSSSVYRYANDSIVRSGIDTAVYDSNGYRWWEIFQDPVLDSLIEAGLKNNKNSLIALKNIEASRLQFRNQKTEILPTFDVAGGINRGNYSGFITPNANTSWNLAGSMSWELDFWGKYRRLTEAAQAEYVASELDYVSIQLTLISEIASGYFDLVANDLSQKIAVKTLELRDSSLSILEQRFEQGIIPEIDLNQAQIQKAIALSAVPQYERNVAVTENSLSVLTGQNPSDIMIGEVKRDILHIPEIPAGIPSDLLYRRPDILSAEQKAIAQNARIGVAIANRYPAISLTGLFGVASSELFGVTTGELGWNLGATVGAPLFHFGRNKRRVEIERRKAEQANLNYEQTVLTALQEVEDALVSIETYRKEFEARQLHTKAALRAQYLSGERYYKGVTSYLEYLEQQRQAFEAQLLMVDALRNLFSSYVNLYKALGGGWLTEKGNEVSPPEDGDSGKDK